MDTALDRACSDRITLLMPILNRISDFDPLLSTPMPAWLAGIVETVVDDLNLEGCILLMVAGTDVEVLADKGLSEADIERITEYARAFDRYKVASIPPTGSCGTRLGLAWRGRIAGLNDRVYTLTVSNLPQDRLLWCGFGTKQPPGDERALDLDLLSLHIGRMMMTMLVVEQSRYSQTSLEKVNEELREMQVCSLNIMEDLQRKNRNLSMLNTISQEIASLAGPFEMAERAAEAVSGMFDGAQVIVFMMDDDRAVLVPHYSTSRLDNIRPDRLEIGDTSPMFGSISAGELWAFDSSDDPSISLVTQALRAKSNLVVPLASKNGTLGFLLICEQRWHKVFTDEERQNVRILAGTLAISFENAKLLARTSGQVDEMSVLKEYIETVVDSVDLGVMVVDKDLKITVFSKGFEKISSHKKSDLLGRLIFEVFPDLLEQGFAETVQHVLNGTPFVRYGWRRTLCDGRTVVQNVRMVPHRDASGRIIGSIAIIEDVTEKSMLEDQLARSEAKFGRLVGDLDDGYLIITGGRVSYANKAASQLTGIPHVKLVGVALRQIFPDEKLIADCLKPPSKNLRHVSRVNHATGTCIPVEVSVNACEYGGSQAVSMVIRDITDRRKIERQLEQKNREMRMRNEQITRLNLELEATVNKLKESQENLIKSERIAAITQTSIAANHEINNPLFSILGHAQLLLRKCSEQDEDTYRRLKSIEESALRIACVTKKLANLADPVVKEYHGLAASMIDIDRSKTK